MSGNGHWKSSGRDYTAAEKLAELEREIIIRKREYPKRVKRNELKLDDATRRLDVLRSIARDFRAILESEKRG